MQTCLQEWNCACSPVAWRRFDACLGSKRHLRVRVAVGCLEECQVCHRGRYRSALTLERVGLTQAPQQRRGMRAQAWRMLRGSAWTLCADPGVGCGALQNLGQSVQSPHCARIEPCVDRVRCCRTNLSWDRDADGSDSLPVQGLQLLRCDVGDKNLVQASRPHRGLGLQIADESAGARRIARRDRRNHHAGLQRGWWLQARHRNRRSVLPVPLKSPEGERFHRQKTRWFQPTKTAQTGELGRDASPGRKEFLRRASRLPRKTRRNHERERA